MKKLILLVMGLLSFHALSGTMTISVNDINLGPKNVKVKSFMLGPDGRVYIVNVKNRYCALPKVVAPSVDPLNFAMTLVKENSMKLKCLADSYDRTFQGVTAARVEISYNLQKNPVISE